MRLDELQEFEDDPNPAKYDIRDLYVRTGVASRNVYFYIQRDLIPKAIGSGPAARYTYEHVVRLRVLRILKKHGLLLREIRTILDGSTMIELHRIADGRDPGYAIDNVRTFGYRLLDSAPSGEAQLVRVAIAKGVQLLVSENFAPRAAVRLKDLIEAIEDILGVPPPEFG